MRRILVAALALALSAAGCGGGEEEANGFREGYDAAVQRLNAAQADIEQGEDRSNRQIAADFRRTARLWQQTRTALAKLDPPERASGEFDELLTALDAGVDDLRAAARAARSNDPEAFEEARDALTESSRDIGAADQELKDAVETD
jgi:hypothetical protein